MGASLVLAWTPAAWSHEFGVALVGEASGEKGAAGVDARDGFRLTVDESHKVTIEPAA